MPGEKVLVTGGAGFIGSHVVDALATRGFQVAVVDDLSTGRLASLSPHARFYHADIRDRAALAAVFEAERPDYVNHHAAQMSVQRSMAEPLYDAEVNVLGSLNLLELACKHKVKKLVYASTGGALYGEPRTLPCDESHPIEPLSNYGVTKRAVELYLEVYGHAYSLNYTILRYANVYGPRQDPFGEAGVVAIFTERMLRDAPATIFGNGQQERDFIFVSDVVEANLLAMEKGDLRRYNIGSGRGTSVNAIFTTLASATEYKREPVYAPPRPGEVFKIYLDNTLAKSELGWCPTVPLEEGLAKTVEYFRRRRRR